MKIIVFGKDGGGGKDIAKDRGQAGLGGPAGGDKMGVGAQRQPGGGAQGEILAAPIAAARRIRRIRSLAEVSHAEVWFGHDIPQFESLWKASEGWYE